MSNKEEVAKEAKEEAKEEGMTNCNGEKITKQVRVQLSAAEEERFEAMYLQRCKDHFAGVLKKGGNPKVEDFVRPKYQVFQNELMRKALGM